MERTLLILKPDAVERGLVGEILRRVEARGLRLVAVELRKIDRELAAAHYDEHVGKDFFEGLLELITRSPSLLVVLEGPSDAYAVLRSLLGATDPKAAAPGTIRGDWGTELPENLVHGSDSRQSGAREIALFFPKLPG
ncbi:MAG: nucleoside-diphosphate kinase [Acidimicrobiales bacterium]